VVAAVARLCGVGITIFSSPPAVAAARIIAPRVQVLGHRVDERPPAVPTVRTAVRTVGGPVAITEMALL
jgi:hypothetical protein